MPDLHRPPLGEDLIHTRDYSDETARVIGEEIARLLDDQAERARRTLQAHRPALEAVAAALIEHETLTGDEVGTIVERTNASQLAPAANGDDLHVVESVGHVAAPCC